ncbi:MAG: glycosyltransferase family 2 protein [Patescibacteria group bacterium]
MKTLARQYKTAVSLVVYNGAKYLSYCLAGIAEQTYKDFFLLIIDNASIDESVKVINNFLITSPELHKRTRIVANSKNLGFARAHNQVFQWTAGDYFFLLNQDVLLDENYLYNLVKFAEKKTNAAAFQGKILKWFFNPTSYRLDLHKNLHKISTFDSCGLAVSKSRHTYNIREGEFDQAQAQQDTEVFGVTGAAPLYRRSALEHIKYDNQVLDEDFVTYKEDVDISWRLKNAGFEAWYVPQAICYHHRSLAKPERLALVTQARAHWPEQMKVYSCRNHWLVLLKNDCLVNLLRYFPYIFWYEIKKLGYRLFIEPKVLFKAIAQFIFLFPAALKKRSYINNNRKISCSELRRWFL